MIGLGLGLALRLGMYIRRLANALTPGYDLYVSDNLGTPLNTANYLNATLTTVITFPSLLGNAITSNSGTAVIAISGNTIICTTAGTLTGFSLSSGQEFLITEGIGDITRSTDGTLIGLLSGTYTWATGQTTGLQTSTNLRNVYYYNNGSIEPIRLGITPLISGNTFELDVVMPKYTATGKYYFNYYSAAETKGVTMSFTAGAWSFYLGDGTTLIKNYKSSVNTNNSVRYKVRMDVNAGATDVACYVNDVLVTNLLANGGFVNSTITSPIIMGQTGSSAAAAYGTLVNMKIGGIDYNLENSFLSVLTSSTATWKPITYVGNGAVDSINEAYKTTVSPTGYDFTRQVNHHYNTQQIIDQSGHSAIGLWVEWKGYKDTSDIEILAKNDLFTLQIQSGTLTKGKIKLTFNGSSSATSTALPTIGKKYYIGIYLNGAGGYQYYIGDEDTPMALVAATGFAGVGAISTSPVILGTDSGIPHFGKVEQFNHHPIPYTLEMFENDRKATKKNIIDMPLGFTYTFPFTLL